MIAIIVTIKVKAECIEQFQEEFAKFTALVRKNEPGNQLFQLCRVREESSTFRVLELYASEDALKAHGASAHTRTCGPILSPMFDGAPTIEFLDAV